MPATAPPAAAPGYIFTYSTEHLAKKDKVRFFYALKGRDGKPGIVQRAAIEHLGRTVLLAPERTSPDVEQFLMGWGCEFSKRRVLLP
jgi:hypothetical protein